MKYIFFMLTVCGTFVSKAQDIIYKKDNTKVEARLLEVGAQEVKYKLSSNAEGPVYLLPKAEIATVVFQNGSFDVYSEKGSKRKGIDSLSLNFCRNYIGIDLGEFTHTSIGMTYEHTFGKKGKWALRIPFAVGLGHNDYTYNSGVNEKIFSTGMDLLFFPTGQGRLRYYVAPYFEWGIYNTSRIDGFIHDLYPQGYYSYQYNTYRYAAGMKNGMLFQVTRHFALSADLGLGIQNKRIAHFTYDRLVQPQVTANLIAGYRF